MQVLSPAKLNLFLRVARPRADGFHPLLSWMCRISLFDTITFERTTERGRVSLTCDDPALATDESNLIVRAVRALDASLINAGERSRLGDSGLAISLHKRIPQGGGLGGGSSNAGTTLLALDDLWESRRGRDFLHDIAAKIGSDVPFFIHGPSSVCTGRGEIIQPTPAPQARHACLFMPDMHLATPAVYRKFDELLTPATVDEDELRGLSFTVESSGEEMHHLKASPATIEVDRAGGPEHGALLPAAELMTRLVNDLEPAAFALQPALATLRLQLQQTLGRVVRMSGSGSTLFTLFDSAPEAQAAAELVAIRMKIKIRAVEVG